ncbi:MAG TPA: ABC transporter permease [Candidatus Acidoferrales bacterium]|jgi:putative ABC transport system permease protein|nr:ABC transporter permease [Candidatus Acidoferrales bacterium]
MEKLWQDLKYSIRMLIKNPGFAAVAVLSLTLGIGANTTIFTLVKAVFMQPFPVKDAGRLVMIYSTNQPKGGTLTNYLPSSYLNATDYREKNDVFSGLSMYQGSGDPLDINGRTEGVGVQLINWDFFGILGVQPALGRWFLPEEDKTPGAKPVAILSHMIWTNDFGRDPGVIGKTIRLNSQDFTVVGVAPESFHQVGALGTWDIWVPMMMHDQIINSPLKNWYPRRGFRMIFMIARLKPGVSLAQAQASVSALGDQLSKEYPDTNSGRNVSLMPFDETNVRPQEHGMFVLAGTLMSVIVGLVLLIACGNVANLLLARANQRRRELAIRVSMGASRGRIVRQLLTESVLLALISAGLGVICAVWSKDLIWKLRAGGRPEGLDTSTDARVLIFTLGISIVATLLFGLIPALQATRIAQITALKDRSDSHLGGSRWYGFRGILVSAQVALSLIALMGAGLFVHSLLNAQKMDPGFESKSELLVFLNPGDQHYTQPQAEQFYSDALARVRALPMVTAAGISDTMPLNTNTSANMFPEGVNTNDPRLGKMAPEFAVLPGFFSGAGISMLAGRDFNDHDDAQAARVVVVNKALADVMWPGQSPLGKRMYFHAPSGADWNVEVVGEVRTVKVLTLGEDPQPVCYIALKQQYSPYTVLYVHTKEDPDSATATILSAVQSVGPKMTIGGDRVLTLPRLMSETLFSARFGAELLACFASLALLLAAIGTYGVMSYSVGQRTHEIGIRMALGAQRRNILGMVMGNGMAMVLAGTAAAFGASLFLTRTVSALLYGIESFDLISFAATAAILLLVAAVACWLPARRAMRVDPMIALRYE